MTLIIPGFSVPRQLDRPTLPRLLHAAIRRLHRIKRRLQVDSRDRNTFSIGIFEGTSPTQFRPHAAAANPVLTRHDITDVPAELVADPFMVRIGHQWWMFFEVLNRDRGMGEIGLAVSEDLIRWRYQGIALREPFHLSYPYVFEWNGRLYMLPESYDARDIRLYKCTGPPTSWTFVTTLLGRSGTEPSILFHDNKWWLFTETAPNCTYDCLQLFFSDELTGPWREHPKSPVVLGNPRIARPGGRIVAVNGKLFRYAQDCLPEYGTGVRALEILELTTTSYQEREIENRPLLSPSGKGWNAFGMHHIDPHQLSDGRWIACVDGR